MLHECAGDEYIDVCVCFRLLGNTFPSSVGIPGAPFMQCLRCMSYTPAGTPDNSIWELMATEAV